MAKSLYVGNLPWAFSSQDLEKLFQTYGAVESAKIVSDRATGRSKGFGFVSLSDESAENAVRELNGREIDGRAIKVNFAREDGGGSGGGGGRPHRGGGGGDRGRRQQHGGY